MTAIEPHFITFVSEKVKGVNTQQKAIVHDHTQEHQPAFIPFPINSIDTMADGNKIYHGNSLFMTITVGNNVPVGEEAILTVTSPSQTQMTVFLK
jgi:hypothetical protein